MAVATANRVSQAFVIMNPVAGRTTADTLRAAFEQHLANENWTYDLYETTGDEDIPSIVREAVSRGVDVVIAAGGDGTLSAVANGLIHTATPMGIIPAGTANVLAQELGIPLDSEEACRLVTGEHVTTCIDAVQIGDQYFILHVGIGIESLMIRDTPRAAKRRFGRAAYLWTALRWLIGYQPRRFTILADGKRIRPRAAQVLIANGGTLGTPPLRWGPDIAPDDGRIDICIISARTVADYFRVAWHILRGKRGGSHKVRYIGATQSITVSSDAPLPVQGDGEIIGETPVQIKVVPNAVHVVVPAEHGARCTPQATT